MAALKGVDGFRFRSTHTTQPILDDGPISRGIDRPA